MQTFNEVVKGIRKSEKNVDKVLKAARLERVESGRMSDYRFDCIVDLIELFMFGAAMTAIATIFILAIAGII